MILTGELSVLLLIRLIKMCFSKHLIYAEIYTDFVLGVWLEMHRYRISRLILTDLLVVTDNIIITNLKM